ncbi:MAG: adenosylcobinamide-GDP ribazoletransferase [Nitrospirota bacterium]
MVKPLLIALGFLTIFPCPIKMELRPIEMGRSMSCFTLAGAFIGGILVGIDVVLSTVLPRSVVDFILIVTLAIITGGLHLDGLADTFDGLYGGRTREETLAIMKDSRVGAIGVVSLIFVIILKYITLLSIPAGLKPTALVVMPALSRWSMVLAAYFSGYARPMGGIGRDFIETVSRISLFIATAFALIVGIAALGWKGGLIFLFIGGITIIWAIYFHRRLGGVTGDILGSINEVNEAMVLISIVSML